MSLMATTNKKTPKSVRILKQDSRYNMSIIRVPGSRSAARYLKSRRFGVHCKLIQGYMYFVTKWAPLTNPAQYPAGHTALGKQ